MKTNHCFFFRRITFVGKPRKKKKNEYASCLIKWKAENAFRDRLVHKTEGVIRPTSLASHSDCQTPLQLIVAANEHNVLGGYFVLYQPLCCAKSSFLLPSYLWRGSVRVWCALEERKTPPDCLLFLVVMLPDLLTSVLYTRVWVLPYCCLSINWIPLKDGVSQNHQILVVLLESPLAVQKIEKGEILLKNSIPLNIPLCGKNNWWLFLDSGSF